MGLLAGTLCGASAQHHAAGDGLPVARADLPRQLRDAEERLGWTGGAGVGWGNSNSWDMLGQFFGKTILRSLFFWGNYLEQNPNVFVFREHGMRW